MSTREKAAREFAEAIGWKRPDWDSRSPGFLVPNPQGQCAHDREWYCEFPAPDAPLHEHLAFVGRIAEAVASVLGERDPVFAWGWVRGALENCIEGARVKYDPSWAALLAATSALTSVKHDR